MRAVSVIESQLASLASWVIRYPKASIITSLSLVLILSLGLSRLYIDVTNESMFHSDDSTLKQFQQFQTQFGRDDVVIAAIESPRIFTSDFLTKLEVYHRDIENRLPYLDKVTSLVSVTSVSDNNGDILIDDLRTLWPTSENDFYNFKKTVVSNPLYRNLFISEDGNITLMVIRASVFASEFIDSNQVQSNSIGEQVIHWHDRLVEHLTGVRPTRNNSSNDIFFTDIDLLNNSTIFDELKPLSTSQLQTFIRELKVISDQHYSQDFQIRLLGGNIISDEHIQSIHLDFASLLPITFLSVFVLLFFMLRYLAAALIPLLIVMLTVMATMGLMGWLSLPVTPVTIALPPLLLTIGVADSVHILSAYYGKRHSLDHESAIIFAIQRTGLAVVFTTLTTIAGFLAFIIADIKPIAHFGFLVAFGVTLALLLSIILIPAFLQLRYHQNSEKQPQTYSQKWFHLTKPMLRLSQLSLAHANKVLIALVMMVALCIPGITQLKFSHNTLEWFPEDKPVRVNTHWADQAFDGTIPFELVIDTGKKNGLYDPLVMQKLESFQDFAESLKPQAANIGRATSIVDTIKRIHWVLYRGNPETTIPDSSDLVAQELLLFESSGVDDVSELIDRNFSMARITIRLSWVDAVDYLPIRKQLLNEAKRQFSGIADVWATGSIDLISRTLVNVMQSMSTSYVIAASVIAIMLILLMRSLTLGLVSLVPNFLPIIISLGLMGYLDIPLNMFTVLLGGIALGLAVDDTVHFMHGYCYHRRVIGQTLEDSVKNTVLTVGPALLFTTIAIGVGFLVFVFSDMNVVIDFGLLMTLTIVNALLLDLLITPALLSVIDRWGLVNFNFPKFKVS